MNALREGDVATAAPTGNPGAALAPRRQRAG